MTAERCGTGGKINFKKIGYGILEGPLEFFKRQEEVVACAADHRTYSAGAADRIGRRLGPGAIYLYFILNKKRRKQIEALAAIALFLLVLARWQRSWTFVWIAGAIFLLGLVWSGFAEMLRAGWMKLAEGMGFVSGKIILTLVFFVVLLPVAFFAKRAGKLNIRLKPDGRPGFKVRDHRYVKDDLENPW